MAPAGANGREGCSSPREADHAPIVTQPAPETPAPPRYVVGIDLGTTNCAVACVDTAADGPAGTRVTTWAIPQFVAAGTVEGRENLPSFLYRPADGEFPAGALAPPWAPGSGKPASPDWTAGAFARDHGAKVPGRQVSSSKSWLCHPGVDRTAPLLPWHAAEGVDRLSPVDASAALLAHVRATWDHARPGAALAEQDVVLTLPASFDEVARELTVKAARAAGLPRVVLIEEPQAAFYAWLAKHPDDWRAKVEPNTNVLVCDIGGGTSDFALIRVKPGSPSPRFAVAVRRRARGKGRVPPRRRRRAPDPRRGTTWTSPSPTTSKRRSRRGGRNSRPASGTCWSARAGGRRRRCWGPTRPPP